MFGFHNGFNPASCASSTLKLSFADIYQLGEIKDSALDIYGRTDEAESGMRTIPAATQLNAAAPALVPSRAPMSFPQLPSHHLPNLPSSKPSTAQRTLGIQIEICNENTTGRPLHVLGHSVPTCHPPTFNQASYQLHSGSNPSYTPTTPPSPPESSTSSPVSSLAASVRSSPSPSKKQQPSTSMRSSLLSPPPKPLPPTSPPSPRTPLFPPWQPPPYKREFPTPSPFHPRTGAPRERSTSGGHPGQDAVHPYEAVILEPLRHAMLQMIWEEMREYFAWKVAGDDGAVVVPDVEFRDQLESCIAGAQEFVLRELRRESIAVFGDEEEGKRGGGVSGGLRLGGR